MEICRILFFLTIFPSLVAFLTSVTNARVRLLLEMYYFCFILNELVLVHIILYVLTFIENYILYSLFLFRSMVLVLI